MIFGILTHLFERFCAGVAAWRDEHDEPAYEPWTCSCGHRAHSLADLEAHCLKEQHGLMDDPVSEPPHDGEAQREWWEARITISAANSNRDGVWNPHLAALARWMSGPAARRPEMQMLLLEFQGPPLRGRPARANVAPLVPSLELAMLEGAMFELYMGPHLIGAGELIRRNPERTERTTP